MTFSDNAAFALAEAIFDSVREPLLVLDHELRVAKASDSFYAAFRVTPPETIGRLVYELGNGQWKIQALQDLLEEIIASNSVFDDFEVEHDFETLGVRTMLLNARPIASADLILLAIEDVTERKRNEKALLQALEQAKKTIDTVREPMLVLDEQLRVLSVNEAYYKTFGGSRDDTVGRIVYELGQGDWDIPALHSLLEDVRPDNNLFDDFVVDHEFKDLGRRTILLNARRIDDVQLVLLAFEDITERQRTADALETSEARFRATYEQSQVGMAEIDLREGRFLSTNQSFCHLLGYKSEDLIGKTINELTHPDDLEVNLEGFRRLVNGEIPLHQLDKRLLRSDGSEVWVHEAVNLVRDSQGRRLHAVAVALDATERKYAEDALRKSDERLRKMINVDGVGVLTFAADGRLISANDAFLQMQGLSREEVESGTLTWRDFTPPEHLAENERQIEKLAETGRIGPYEKEYLRKDGSRSWMLSAGAAVGDGTIVEYCIDLSAQKRAEAALRIAGESFQRLVEESPFGVYAVDADFRLIMISAGAQKVFEHVRPLIGRDFEEVLRIIWPEPFVGEALRHFRHTLATGEPYHAPSMIEQRADIAETEAYDWKIERMILPDGRPGVVCHFYDLSERLRYEEALRESREELQKALAVKDEFLGLVSHELRTPLTAILGMSTLLARGLKEEEDRVEALGTLLEGARRMQTLVENMLIIARLDYANVGSEMEPVRLSRLVRGVIERHSEQYPDRLIEVQDRSSHSIVVGNAGWLEQVLQNFLSNAEKYSGDDAAITVELDNADSELIARVLDNGRGISEEQTSQVFEPFYRDSATATAVAGAGLGLAVCKRLIELQGGRIWARPGSTGGAEFGFALPWVSED